MDEKYERAMAIAETRLEGYSEDILEAVAITFPTFPDKIRAVCELLKIMAPPETATVEMVRQIAGIINQFLHH